MAVIDHQWNSVQWVLTDVDDTLTCHGHLPPESLIALQKLREQNIKVVAVTGACAGWCDHIAQLWPVDAVLGENGAFVMEKQAGQLHLQTFVPMETMRQQQESLKTQILALLEDFPELTLTLDQAYRLCEVAIDIGQNRPPVAPHLVETITQTIQGFGANATASSIHVNAWFGEHSKKAAAIRYLTEKGMSEQTLTTHCCYVGDSLNDEQMFATLPLSAGVANIEKYWSKLTHKPKVVMSKNGGYGFAEFVEALLKVRR